MSFQVWNPDWFPLAGQAVFDRDKQKVTAVSRAPGNLDLFVIGFDNHIWTTFWNEQGGWNADWFPVPGQAVFDRDKQRVAAVSRASGNLDLFVIGFDNHIWTTFWNNNGWNPDWFPVPGQAVFDRDKQHVAAVSRASENLDLFVIGFDNHIWTTFWNSNGWNQDWFPVPGLAVFDREKQQVAAVSRASGNLDLFLIGFDNHIWTTFWNSNGWNPDWFPVPGVAVFDREKQQVAAVSRASENLDLFVIGFDNHIWTTFWNSNGWSPDWFPVPGLAVFDREKQQVAAVSRASENLDLFVIGFDNHIWTTFWNNTGWNPDCFPLPGQAVFDHVNQHVAAVSRTGDHLDLFLIGLDNHVWSTFWGPRTSMTLDVEFHPSSATLPLHITINFGQTDGMIITETKWHVTKNGVIVPNIGQSILGTPGAAFSTILGVNDPGLYVINVSRTGLTGTNDPTTLTKEFSINAQFPAQPVTPPPAIQSPTIQATFSGSIQNAKFHVTGGEFLKNRPASNQGVTIRVVDANALIETRREFTGSTSEGKIDANIEGNLVGLTLNALGVATIALSATDGRTNSADATGFLWSNTVRIDFHG